MRYKVQVGVMNSTLLFVSLATVSVNTLSVRLQLITEFAVRGNFLHQRIIAQIRCCEVQVVNVVARAIPQRESSSPGSEAEKN